MKPDRYGAGRKAAIAFAMNDRPIRKCRLAPLALKSRQASLYIGVHGNMPTTTLALGCPVL